MMSSVQTNQKVSEPLTPITQYTPHTPPTPKPLSSERSFTFKNKNANIDK